MRVLVISAHPDDETLGCGGTLMKHRAAGDNVEWLIVTSPYEPVWDRETIQAKQYENDSVASAYGFDVCHRLGFPATGLDTVPIADIIEKIREVVSQARPELVYVVHGGDVHTDHTIVFTAATSVMKPMYMTELGIRRVLSYETLSSTEASPPSAERAFLPNVIADITPHIAHKIEVMNLYITEKHSDPFPRGPGAIHALARFRGATIGVEYAEAFMLLREII